MVDDRFEQGSRRAWWGVFVLFLAYTLSFVDRTILSLLVEPIKRDLGVSDTGVSLLQGLAFALFYTIAGVPIAGLADRMSRRRIISAGIALWSVMTGLCGLAGNFVQLFLARMGVGVGEAALSPAAYSLIADMFPEEKRGRAMAVYASGTNFGAGAALLIGGLMIGLVADLGAKGQLPAGLQGWQAVFLVVGLPGLLIALLALTLPEPPRGMRRGGEAPMLWPFIKTHRRAVVALFLGLACCGTVSASNQAWAPTYFIRVFGYTAPEIGRQLGMLFLVAGPLGAFSGGSIADMLARRGHPDAAMRAVLIGAVLMTGFGPAAMAMPTPGLALTMLFLSTFCGAFCYPAGAAALQKLFPGELRARATAIYLLVVALVSGIVGPTAVALVTDYVFHNPLRIGTSLGTVMGTAGAIGVVLIATGLKSFRESASRPA